MFIRTKKSGSYEYLQVVHNERVDGKVKQRVIATLGRKDVLEESGQLDGLASSCARFAKRVAVLDAYRKGHHEPAEAVRFGPPLVFERLWRELGIGAVLEDVLEGRKFEFPVERAVFLTALHRLFDPGSDRAAEKWATDYAIEGADGLQLHHLYRAMAWLGEELPAGRQRGRTPFAPRTVKDRVEEGLFRRRRDLFTSLRLVFFDTTSIYFCGEGGETLGERGHSKDKRPDLKQMVVGAVVDQDGRPVCCEMWPGNTSDVKSFLPVIDRLRSRFGVQQVCVVGDRGMISKDTVEAIKEERPGTSFILGARMRRVKEVREEVLSRAGRYREVRGEGEEGKAPAPLKVKEVWVEDRRYIVALNEEQARKDRADREAIAASLREKLRRGEKALIGNKGYRKYVKATGEGRFELDEEKLEAEARFDGKWVLRTDTDLDAAQVALRYKDLWMVEDLFRTVKSVLRTRPVYHSSDEAIRGHVFCSFLAMTMLRELLGRIEARGERVQWQELRHQLDALQHVTIRTDGKAFRLRTEVRGEAHKAVRAAGVAPGPVVKQCSQEEQTA